MSPFGLKFSPMILHTSKLTCNGSFLFVVLHRATLLPSTFKIYDSNYKHDAFEVYWSFLYLIRCLLSVNEICSSLLNYHN